MKRALAWLFGTVVLLFVVSFPVGAFLFRHLFYEPRVGASAGELEALIPKIEDDLKVIAAKPPFENGTRLKNAAPMLLRYVSLSDDAIEPLKTQSHLLLRGLFDQYPLWMTDEQQSAAFLKNPDLAKIETDWLAELENFDHIELMTEEPIKSRLQSVPHLGSLDRISLAASLPVLNTPELTKFATVHVLQAQSDPSRRAALGRLHKLGQLFQGDGTLVGQMAALAVLGRERWLAERFKIADWPVFTREELTRFRRVAWVWPGVFRLTESREFPKALEPYVERRFGACAGAAEATIAGIDQLSDFLEPWLPLEPNFTDELLHSRTRKRRTLEACGQTALLPLLAPVDEGVDRIDGSQPHGVPGWLRHFPYVRKIVGMVLNSITVPDSTKDYKSE